MKYDKKSHVQVVICDNLEREMAKNIRNIFFFISCRRGKPNGNRNGMVWYGMVCYGMVAAGPEWAGKTEESCSNTPRKCRKVCADKPATRQRF